MKTISQRYKQAVQEFPRQGNYLSLSMAIRGMKFGKQKVVDAFNKYVPKSDYAKDEKDMLLTNLFEVTNAPEKALFLANEKVEA